MGSICNDCQSSDCACSVPECAESLILGTVADADTLFYIYIEKQNGKREILQATSDSNGQLTLDLTDPNKPFYNRFDGQYKIWVANVSSYGYYCEDDRVTVTASSNLLTYETLAINFYESGSQEFQVVYAQPKAT